MDFVYTDSKGIEIGFLRNCSIDLEIGTYDKGSNDFQITISQEERDPNLTYESSDTLTKVVGFSKEVEQVIFSIVGNTSNPRDQVYRAYAQIGWNDSKKNVNFIVKGGGFVNGHILPINYLVKLKD